MGMESQVVPAWHLLGGSRNVTAALCSVPGELTLSIVQTLEPFELLADMAACPASGHLALGGGSTAKVLGMRSTLDLMPGPEMAVLPPGHMLDRVCWGQSGQARGCMAVAT